jgi:hypothetical protein
LTCFGAVTIIRERIIELAKVTVVKIKKVKQSHYRPEVAQREVKVPRLHDNGTGWW